MRHDVGKRDSTRRGPDRESDRVAELGEESGEGTHMKHDEDRIALLAAAGPLAPSPEALPPGVLPEINPLAGRNYLDAWPVFGWIAWRTATWSPPTRLPQGNERTELEADLERAHCELLDALRAGHLTVVARYSNKPMTERVDSAVFHTPGLLITPHGYAYFTLDPGYHTPDGVMLVSLRFSTAEVAKCWPPPVPASDTEIRAVFSPQSKIAATIAGEKRLQAWLEAKMRASPDVSPGKEVMRALAEARVRAEAGDAFSGESFKRAWAAAVRATGAEAWSKAGRKSKGAHRKAE